MFACLIIRGLQLVVELQGKLNLPCRLGTGDLSDSGTEARVRRVVLYMVEGIDEFASELQFEALRELEVLGQAEVHVTIVWTTETRELWSAIAESSVSGVGKVVVVGEPLNAPDTAANRRIKDGWEPVAIGACAAAEGSGVIRCAVNRQRPASAERDDGGYLPTAHHGVDYTVHIVSEGFAAAEGKLVNGVGS